MPTSCAAQSEQKPVARLSLDNGNVDPDSNDEHGVTPMLEAARNGHEAVVKLLLDNGNVDPDSKNEHGVTPMLEAARNGHEAVVKLLLDNGNVDPESKTKCDMTPLRCAVRNGHEAVVRLLIGHNRVDLYSEDRYGMTPLRWAARNGHEGVVRLLLSNSSIDPDSKDTTSARTSLLWAARSGHEAVVGLLLHDDRVDPNVKDKYGATPILDAAQSGHEAVVRLLLGDDRVDPNAKDKYGATPILKAAQSGHEAVVGLLLHDDRVDANVKDKYGATPLLEAARSGHEAVVRLLLGDGRFDPTAKTDYGATPLLEAARSGREAVVRLLLRDDRVDPNAKDKHGATAILKAARSGHEAVVRLLLGDDRVDPDSKDTTSGRTPLSWAARNGHKMVVELLLQSDRVDPNSKDEHGVTPLLWAKGSGHEAVQKLLLLDSSRMRADPKARVGLEIGYRCLARWIQACNDQHDGCCQSTRVRNPNSYQTPDWVIDTWDACIVPGHTVSSYIALSYVWRNTEDDGGSSKVERLLLERSNPSKFQEPGYLNKTATIHLPQVVTDTVDLVRKLGERYLWVDCLCIVQDDEHTRAKVERMSDIYSGTYFTVIGATSSGLVSMQRTTNRYRQRVVSRDDTRTAREHIEGLYHSLFRSKWATRGWTLQEQILSKRAVIFVDGNIFWDCQRSVWDSDELFPEASAEIGDSITSPYYEMARRMSSVSWPDFRMYIEMVGLYNSRDLTYPQDALPAISGILNSLTRSFPSGFVSGLPRLFLDIALLWQPFSKAKRRIAKDGGMVAPNRHLPSWSWCGWQCPVDPYSLRTGLAYLERTDCRSRASTWRTQNLVQWYVLSKDRKEKQRLEEPGKLEEYRKFFAERDAVLPDGWSRHTDKSSTLPDIGDGTYFTHKSDNSSRFRHPVPVEDVSSSTAVPQDIWPFLSCETSRAFLWVGAILEPQSKFEYHAALKASVFELPLFTDGPAFQDICHVLRLEDKQGRPAGVLRRMDDAEVKQGEEIELIAISSGSVGCMEQGSVFEEKINQSLSYSYRHDLTRIRFGQVLSGGRSIETARNIDAERDTGRIAPHRTEDGGSEGEYHFYNVLWIERQGEIAYRRAAGRVQKAIWEENCSMPIKIVLG